MTHMKKFIQIVSLLTILTTAFQSAGFAQDEARTGSFYSGLGFGTPSDINSTFSMGMGLSGVSNYSGYSTNIANPAQWGLINYTVGSISANLDQFVASDGLSSANNVIFGLESFQFTFPVLRGRLGISAAFTPRTNNNFRREQTGSFLYPGNPDDSVNYSFSTIGSGGVNRFEIGAGYRVFNHLAVGYAFSVNALTMNHETQPLFSDAVFTPSRYISKIQGNSIGHRFGIYTFTNRIFGDQDQLAMGLSVTLPLTIDAENEITTYQIINGRQNLLHLNQNSPDRNGDVTLPLEINAGLTYNFTNLTNVNTEILYQNWDEVSFSFDKNQEGYYKDRLKFGAGLQHHPYRSSQQQGFFSNFKYSAGITYDTGHLTIRGHDIETLYLNAGLGIVNSRSVSSVDLSFHYGIRGTEASNLVKENVWGFKLSLNLAEFMFVRQRFQ